MEMREHLNALGCKPETHDYLHDGVCCGTDGLPQIWLVADRDGQRHSIALDEETLAALYRYARQHIKEPTE